MPEFQGRHDEQEAWKAAVLNGEIILEDIDTDPFDFTVRQAPTQKPSKDRRNMVAGVVGRPDSTAISA
ncbi:MAG: hypothetical protein F4X81_13700 [Gammaproteobacteria bacterium]|nr:hypothetical protein [Gammaproteobacteria bacterium]